MNDEFAEYEAFKNRLHDCYPDMFNEPYGGICVDKGWWPIIETLCANIHSHVKFNNQQKERFGQGELCSPVTVNQIKEKFGSLRFYYSGGDAAVAGMVTMAESFSSITCETCGKPGKLHGGGWIKTLCDEHEAERQLRQKSHD